jgi:glycosyltransferase involved in cell wall biosynthesis
MAGLRFCMITTFYPPHNFGGDGIGIRRLSEALVRRGHEVTVVYDADAFAALSSASPPVARPAGNPRVIGLKSRLGMFSPLLTQQTGHPVINGGRIRRILDEGDFDVTVFNNMSLIGGPALLSEGRGVTLYEAHEHWLVCPMHVLWRHNREPCVGRQCIRCTLAFRRPPQWWRYTGLLQRSIESVDGFIAKSEFSRRKHEEFGFDREMRVIPYFLPDTDPDAVGVEPVERERPYFLFVGRLERIKGLDDVIPAFRQYRDADLLIAGAGEHAGPLQRLAEGASNIHFLGRVEFDRLRALYRGALGLIVPSRGYETFGIILIEAFREGVPVIARRIGPFPEIVETSGAGLLFDGPTDLLDAMRTLQSDEAMRERLGHNGRRAYEQHWTEKAVVPQYLGLIREIAERKGGQRVRKVLDVEEMA